MGTKCAIKEGQSWYKQYMLDTGRKIHRLPLHNGNPNMMSNMGSQWVYPTLYLCKIPMKSELAKSRIIPMKYNEIPRHLDNFQLYKSHPFFATFGPCESLSLDSCRQQT